MRQIFERFTLEAAKFNWQVFVCLVVIWALLVWCATASIKSQNFNDHQRRTWLWVVVCVPLFGMLAYLPFSIRRDDLPQIFLLKWQKNRAEKKIKNATSLKGGRSA